MSPWGLPEPVHPTDARLIEQSRQAVVDAQLLVDTMLGCPPRATIASPSPHSGSSAGLTPDLMVTNHIRRKGRPRSYVPPVREIDNKIADAIREGTL